MERVDLIVGEGATEIAIAQRLLDHAGIDRTQARLIDKGGRNRFWSEIGRYAAAAHAGYSVFALADLELDPCPPHLLLTHTQAPRPNSFCLRIAVRMAEAWILADTEGVATWLRISRVRLPRNPEFLHNPKLTLVNLARHSPVRGLRESLVPERGSRGVVGREYLPTLTKFIHEHWAPSIAATRSESLKRAMLRLEG